MPARIVKRSRRVLVGTRKEVRGGKTKTIKTYRRTSVNPNLAVETTVRHEVRDGKRIKITNRKYRKVAA